MHIGTTGRQLQGRREASPSSFPSSRMIRHIAVPLLNKTISPSNPHLRPRRRRHNLRRPSHQSRLPNHSYTAAKPQAFYIDSESYRRNLRVQPRVVRNRSKLSVSLSGDDLGDECRNRALRIGAMQRQRGAFYRSVELREITGQAKICRVLALS